MPKRSTNAKKPEKGNLKKHPVTLAAYKFIADQGLVRSTFVASPGMPYQSVADYWSILKIEAQKKERQLTLKEVKQDFEMHLEIVSYLYGMYYHKNYSKGGHLITEFCEENKQEEIERLPRRAQEIIKELEPRKEKEKKKRLEKEAEEEKRYKAELAEFRKNALKLSFIKGRNPKYGDDQWEARQNGRLYVLRRENGYDPKEGAIPVMEMFDLVPGRITLVARIPSF